MVARVMHNFGLKDLIVVSPRDKWLNNKSINAAKKATKIIKNIKVYDDLEIALSNFSMLWPQRIEEDIWKKILLMILNSLKEKLLLIKKQQYFLALKILDFQMRI